MEFLFNIVRNPELNDDMLQCPCDNSINYNETIVPESIMFLVLNCKSVPCCELQVCCVCRDMPVEKCPRYSAIANIPSYKWNRIFYHRQEFDNYIQHTV